MPGHGPGTLKKPQLPSGTASVMFPAGCQRQSPFRQTLSRVGVASREALARSQTAVTPCGSVAADSSAPSTQSTSDPKQRKPANTIMTRVETEDWSDSVIGIFSLV